MHWLDTDFCEVFCDVCSGAQLSDDKDSPLPGARREENERTREKMQFVRSQMESMSLMKDRKAKVCCVTAYPHV